MRRARIPYFLARADALKVKVLIRIVRTGRIAMDSGGPTTEQGEGGVAVAEGAKCFQGSEAFREREGATMLGDDDGCGSEEGARGEEIQDAGVFFGGCVGRIEKDVGPFWRNRTAAGSERFKPAEGVERKNSSALANSKAREIGFDERDGGAVRFDEGGGGSSAAERFDADGAGTGKEIEKMRAFEMSAENVEESFAKIVAGGPEIQSFEGFEQAGAILAGDNAHEEKFRREKPEVEACA